MPIRRANGQATLIDPSFGAAPVYCCADNTQRNMIPFEERNEGMIAYTFADKNYWSANAEPWDGSDGDWTQFTGGGGGAITLTGDVSGSGSGTINITVNSYGDGLTFGTMAQQDADAVDISGGTITGLPTPTTPSDAANKAYVDAATTGLSPREACRVATTGALTATYANGTLGVGATLTNSGTQAALAIDSVTLDVDDRVLVKNMAAPARNGIYTVTDQGDVSTNWVLTRTTDYDQAADVVTGSYTVITAGTTLHNTLWIETGLGPFTIGTTAIVFTQLIITDAGTVTSVATGTGLTGGPITTVGTVSIAAGGVGTTQLAAAGVTYAKIQNEAARTLLGNPTGAPAATSELTLGAGLSFSGTTLVSTGGGAPIASWVLGPGVPLAVGNDVTINWYPLLSGGISGALINAKGGGDPTGPVGADLILDIKKSSNGGGSWTSLWASNPSRRPTIADGATVGVAGPTDTITRSLGDLLRIDVIQVGSTTPGSNVSLVLY